MLTDSVMLNYIHKGAQIGSGGIQCVLKRVSDDGLRQTHSQRPTEYAHLYETSAQMLRECDRAPREVPPKIAQLTAEGNTMDTTRSLTHLHDYTQGDQAVRNLAATLL